MPFHPTDQLRPVSVRLAAVAGLLLLAGAGTHPAPAASTPVPTAHGASVAYLDGTEVRVKNLSDPATTGRKLATVLGPLKVRWSAAGRYLAVEGETGLTVLPVNTPGAASLTGVGGWTWAPSGDRLALLRADGLWLHNPAGQDRCLFEAPEGASGGSGSIAWSPDGSRIAFVRSGKEATLCTIRTDGAGLRTLYRSRADRNAPVLGAWSPDGRQLGFWSLYTNRAVSVNADGVPFLTVPAEGGKARPVGGPEVLVRREGYFDYSPDGRYLLLAKGSGRFDVQNKRLARVDTRTGRWQWLTPSGLAATAPRFSRDGRRVAFVAVADPGGEAEIGQRSARRRLWIMNADGSGRKALTSDPRYADSNPRWLPDGRILFLREPKDAGRSGLWTLDPQGGKPALAVEFQDEPLGEPETRFDVLLR